MARNQSPGVRRLSILITGLCVAVLLGCDGKDLSSNFESGGTGGTSGGGDAGSGEGGGGSTGGGAGGGAGGGDTGGGAGGGDVGGGDAASGIDAPGVEPWPGGCEGDGDCGASEVCVLGICVEPPPQDFEARFSCDDTFVEGSEPNFECWQRPAPRADGPATVTARGVVDFFGDGNVTTNLKVQFYEYSRFDPSMCLDAAAGAANAREARQRTGECVEANNMDALVGEDVTELCPNRDDLGCYEIANVPTGVELIARVTGDPLRWVPTYKYALFINPCINPHPKGDGVCPEQRPEAPADNDWSCNLTERDGEVYFDYELTVLSQATWTTFPPTAGVPRINLGKGAIAGQQYDCDGRSVINATIGWTNPGALTTFFNGDPDDTVPQPGLTRTNTLGIYADLDTPPGPQGVVAIAWQGGELRLVNYTRVYLLPDTLVFWSPAGRYEAWAPPPY
jgi:hypothetical protein